MIDDYLYSDKLLQIFAWINDSNILQQISCNILKMQMLAKMNAKLDIGWKMTTLSCPHCNNTTLAEPKAQIQVVYCPKCDKNYQVDVAQQQQNEVEQQPKLSNQDKQSQFYEEIYKSHKANPTPARTTLVQSIPKDSNYDLSLLKNEGLANAFQKSNQVSKKIGEKLLHGWTMLNQSCPDCLAPLMQSKKIQKICFGCNKDYAKIQKQQDKQVKVKQVKVEPTKQQVKVQQSIIQKKQPSVVHSFHKDSTIFDRIQSKTLLFLQNKIDKSIEENDLAQLQRLLSLAYKIKGQFQ